MGVEFPEQTQDINGQSRYKKESRKDIPPGSMLNPKYNRRNENGEKSNLIEQPDLPLFIVLIVDVDRGH